MSAPVARRGTTWGLRFADHRLESLYESVATATLLRLDGAALVVRYVASLFALLHLMRCGTAVSVQGLAWLAVTLSAIAQGALRRGMLRSGLGSAAGQGPAGAEKMHRTAGSRTLIVIACRVCFIVGIPTLYFAAGAAGAWAGRTSALSCMLIGSGALTGAMTPLLHPMLLKHHAPMRVVEAMVSAGFLIPTNCAQGVVDPDSAAFYLRLWRLCSWAVGKVLGTVFATRLEERPAPEALLACYHLSGALLAVELAVGLCACFLLERASRRLFLRDRPFVVEKWEPLAGSAVLHLAVLLCLSFAILWEVAARVFVNGGGVSAW